MNTTCKQNNRAESASLTARIQAIDMDELPAGSPSEFKVLSKKNSQDCTSCFNCRLSLLAGNRMDNKNPCKADADNFREAFCIPNKHIMPLEAPKTDYPRILTNMEVESPTFHRANGSSSMDRQSDRLRSGLFNRQALVIQPVRRLEGMLFAAVPATLSTCRSSFSGGGVSPKSFRSPKNGDLPIHGLLGHQSLTVIGQVAERRALCVSLPRRPWPGRRAWRTTARTCFFTGPRLVATCGKYEYIYYQIYYQIYTIKYLAACLRREAFHWRSIASKQAAQGFLQD